MVQIVQAEQHHIPGIIRIRGDSPFGYEDRLKEELTSPDSQLLVAVDGLKVVGYSHSIIIENVSVHGHFRGGSVAEIEIVPEYRRQGIGSRLFVEIKKWFEARGIPEVEIRVHVNNRQGYSFCKKQGFADYVNVLRLNIEDLK